MKKETVLYFPFINVPSSTWFTRILLYWDSVGTIAPYDYFQKPGKYDAYTRSLVEAGLLEQVIPAKYIYDIPRFVPAFMDYFTGLGSTEIDKRRLDFREKASGSKIHLEKLQEIRDELIREKVARSGEGSWVIIENETATEFMSYLAACLGSSTAYDGIPITDQEDHLHNFINKSVGELHLDCLRLEVLEEVFPAPNSALSPGNLANFKERHSDQLSRFRRKVEQELIHVAALNDDALRTRRLNLFIDEIKDETQLISEAMKGWGWRDTRLAKFASIVSSIPGIPDFVGLAAAIHGAFTKESQYNPNSPYLYAAKAQQMIAT